jgi:hypothetical protein
MEELEAVEAGVFWLGVMPLEENNGRNGSEESLERCAEKPGQLD